MADRATREREEDRLDRTVLVLLLYRELPWPSSLSELGRELGCDPTAAVARLRTAGLLCWFAGYVWPTKAAVRVDELQL